MADRSSLLGHGVRGLLLFGGMEIGYNIGGQTCSAPQTTELRVAGKEGGGAAESTLMKWVHLANAKTFVLTGIVSLVSRSWMPLLGGMLSMVDMFSSYRYAVHCGRKARNGGGEMLGSSGGSMQPSGMDGSPQAAVTPLRRPRS